MAATLSYRVLEGQDPSVVLAALGAAGYRAEPGSTPDSHLLTIELNDDDRREDVRSVIAEVHTTNIEGPPNLDPEPVRFTDEA